MATYYQCSGVSKMLSCSVLNVGRNDVQLNGGIVITITSILDSDQGMNGKQNN